MRIIWWILGIVILVGLVWWLVGTDRTLAPTQSITEKELRTSEETPTDTTQSTPQEISPTESATPAIEVDFGIESKSAHYVKATPAHASTLTAAPQEVMIDFNFDLAPGSSISITSDGVDYAEGETVIADDLLSMSRSLKPSAPAGLYEVSYKACWPDKSCHIGEFKFQVKES